MQLTYIMDIETSYRCQCGEEVTINGGEIHVLLSENDYQEYLKATNCLLRREFISKSEFYNTQTFLKKHNHTEKSNYAFACYYNPKNLEFEYSVASFLKSIEALVFLPKFIREISPDEEKTLLRTSTMLAECISQLRFVREKMKKAEIFHVLKNSKQPLGRYEIARRVFLDPSTTLDYLKILQRKCLIKKEKFHKGFSRYTTLSD